MCRCWSWLRPQFEVLLLPLGKSSDTVASASGRPRWADAAKSITGKPWPQILVLTDDYAIDNHIGWHTLLRQVYLWTQCRDESLVLFSMATLFALVGWSALPWLKRPEAWLITLILTLGVQAPFMRRFMMGRPFMWSMFALLTVLFLWQRRESSPPDKRCWKPLRD